jgi:hypothetical protein
MTVNDIDVEGAIKKAQQLLAEEENLSSACAICTRIIAGAGAAHGGTLKLE